MVVGRLKVIPILCRLSFNKVFDTLVIDVPTDQSLRMNFYKLVAV